MRRTRLSALTGGRFLTPRATASDGWSAMDSRSRDWERAYRNRWQHDRVVRSTHGVNCTGSCSWKVHVKQGIVTWETQQTDYPENGPDVPDYEPRGCPRGASFSCTCTRPCGSASRTSVARSWSAGGPSSSGPAIRSTHGLQFRPIPRRAPHTRPSVARAGSYVPAGTRSRISSRRHTFTRSASGDPIGRSVLTDSGHVDDLVRRRIALLLADGRRPQRFYDWYADLPPASPQIWGDQTDVPESADWWNATYLMMWGSNVPMTRTPDAHFMTEARYRGQKTVVVSPDYSDHTKFADEWLAAQPGSDAALALGWRTLCSASSMSTARFRTSPTTRAATPTCRSS